MNKITKIIAAVSTAALLSGSTYTGGRIEHQLSYDLSGGKAAIPKSAQTASFFEKTKLPDETDLAKDGYTFAGWKDSRGRTVSEADWTWRKQSYTAQWKPAEYAVEYKDRSKITGTGQYTYNIAEPLANNAAITNASAHPYETFAGWKDSLGNTVSKVEPGTKGLYTVSAFYQPKTYKITYDLAGGSADGLPDSYAYGTGVGAFVNPAKDGCTFTGWTDDAGNAVSSIPADAHTDIHLTANYATAYTPAPVQQEYYGSGSAGASIAQSAQSTVPAQAQSSGLNMASGSGNLYIPDVGVNLPVYMDGYGGLVAQAIVDMPGAGWCYEYMGNYVVADHASQGFSAINNCSVGNTVAYLALPDGTRRTYRCSGYWTAYNNGAADGYNNKINGADAWSHQFGDLILQTCLNGSGTVDRIVGFAQIG